MADDAVYRAAFIRMHPTGKVVLSLSEASQGTEAELAGIVAEELGIPPEDVKVVHEDDDRFGERNSFNSAPSDEVGANVAATARKLRDKAQIVAGAMLEVPAGLAQVRQRPLDRRRGRSRGGQDPGGRRARLRRLRDAGRTRRLARRPDDLQAGGRAARGLSSGRPRPRAGEGPGVPLKARDLSCPSRRSGADGAGTPRTPFVEATVVRAQSPTSVRAGDSAKVRADGTIDGFVGGACAEASVRLYALRSLQSGEPVLLRILPERRRG